MEIMIIVLVVIAALLTVVAGLAWVSISFQIRTLNHRIKDYYLIMPDGQKAQGMISAQLFAAMKDVCDLGKAQKEEHKRHSILRNSTTALASEVNRSWDCFYNLEKEFNHAVDRLIKIDEIHEIVKR